MKELKELKELKGIKYVDQHPDALRLCLREETSSWQSTVLSRQTAKIGEIEIEASVIGASHSIVYKVGSSTLHEVFACIRTDDPSYTLMEAIAAPIQRQIGTVSYELTVCRIPWYNPEPTELLQLVAAACSQTGLASIGMVQAFPQGQLRATPKTVIVGSVDGASGFLLKTAHSYPCIGLVMTRSLLQHNMEMS